MAEQYKPNIGQQPEENARRDAIHIAVAPIVAAERLNPGTKIILREGKAEWCEREEYTSIGIVDPFLKQPIEKGQRFWLFLNPDSITSLRHVWSHPSFKAKLPEITNE